ncbi:nitroreductase family deazaflavin-dependent oxidoreductase [Asanoa sp. WMMD1127]|uniref:nitroreductase family deazaflavin-dependent oxidoreductase n=1 Tax=Asanoa sp. WMMD1127 TaxID=3016107 RepID=UPI002417396A|nr:nitroreductase family deazaflavin-dependent oxidoreductase [Asanoa sp. WMMD1127]MDG4823637.1 nitroreductase family deazaflavin-dependent oxidoreductase [Asanoa sp. WMMD1127]
MSLFRATARRLGPTRFLYRVGPVLVPLDRIVSRLTRGRVVALGLIPSALLTTRGRRTGLARDNPLLCLPDGDGFLVVGSNWGRRSQPAWALNLLAEPAATLTVGGAAVPVRARLLDGAERAAAWARLLAVWPGYAAYERRAGHRTIHVFRLDRV